jgi:hypothetical protein
MIKTKSRLFNISSNNTSLNGSFKSKLLLQLPDLTFHNEIIETICISIQHAEIIAFWYNINYTNSNIIINNITYQIPVGNYNANNLITALTVLFPTYTITYSSITNRYTFSNSTAFTISNKSTSKYIIGLGDTDSTAIFNAGLYTLTLPFNVNFVSIARVNLKSDLFKFYNFNGGDNSNDLFLSIQVNTNINSMINYLNQTQIKFKVDDRNITNFILSFVDDNGSYINFNNSDSYITFQIDIEYVETINRNLTFSNLINNSN